MFHRFRKSSNRDSWTKAKQEEDLPLAYKIHLEWSADQRLALLDKDAAEVMFTKELLNYYIKTEVHHELYSSKDASFLRSFDIAKHHNLISSDVLDEKRPLRFSDIQPIFTKHGLSLKSFDPTYEFQDATNTYIQHKNDLVYKSFVQPHLRSDKSTKKRKITYRRIP